MEGSRGKKEFYSIWLLLAGFCGAAVMVLTLCHSYSAGLPPNIGRKLTEEEREEVIERNSGLIDYVCLSPNADFPRKDEIKKLTIHHMAGDLTLEGLGETFSHRDRRASSNYAIDSEGRVALYIQYNTLSTAALILDLRLSSSLEPNRKTDKRAISFATCVPKPALLIRRPSFIADSPMCSLI